MSSKNFNFFKKDPMQEAENRQAHGGFQSNLLGAGLQFFGKTLQAIPPSMKLRKIPTDVLGTLGGKFIENMGKRVEKGLPQNRSLYDILHHDMGHSQEDTLNMLRKKNGGL